MINWDGYYIYPTSIRIHYLTKYLTYKVTKTIWLKTIIGIVMEHETQKRLLLEKETYNYIKVYNYVTLLLYHGQMICY